MSVGSIVPTAIDRLVQTLQASASGYQVYDGPGLTDVSLPAALFVGWSDPEATGLDEAANLDQRWPFLGHTQRDETASIRCVAKAWNGNADMKAARDLVFSTVTAVGVAIQDDPSLGTRTTPVSGIAMMWVSAVNAGALRQNQDEDGALAELVFEIEVRGRVA